jgi:hypothetical protein
MYIQVEYFADCCFLRYKDGIEDKGTPPVKGGLRNLLT